MLTLLRAILAQGTHSQILMTGGGEGADRGSYLVPKKITTSVFVYPKKSLLFLAYPKKTLSSFFATQKIPPFILRPKKIPVSFTDLKNHLWPKFQTPKNHSDPPPGIKICEWDPWVFWHIFENQYITSPYNNYGNLVPRPFPSLRGRLHEPRLAANLGQYASPGQPFSIQMPVTVYMNPPFIVTWVNPFGDSV